MIVDKTFLKSHFKELVTILSFIVLITIGIVITNRYLISPSTENNGTKLTLDLAQKDVTGAILANTVLPTSESPCYDGVLQNCNPEATRPVDLKKRSDGSLDPSSFSRIDAPLTYEQIGTNWTCGLDVYYIVDSSESMNANLEGNISKMSAVKQAIASTNTWLSQQNNLNRVGVLSFYGNSTYSGNPQRPYPGRTKEISPLSTDINQVNSRLNNIEPSDGTPLALGIKDSIDYFEAQWRSAGRVNVPIMILLSDGVPTIDEQDFAYDPHLVADVNIKRTDGTFLPPTTVATLGAPDVLYGHGRKAGVPLYHSMRQANRIRQIEKNGISNQVNTIGFFLRGVSSNIQTDKPDIIEFFSQVHDPQATVRPFYTIDSIAQMQQNLRQKLEEYCIGNSVDNPVIKIDLPPRTLFRPDQLLFDDEIYTFNLTNPPTVSGSNRYNISIELKEEVPGDIRSQYYQILAKDFPKRSEQYQLKLSFESDVPAANVSSAVDYVNDPITHQRIFIGDDECARGSSGENVCTKIKL